MGRANPLAERSQDSNDFENAPSFAVLQAPHAALPQALEDRNREIFKVKEDYQKVGAARAAVNRSPPNARDPALLSVYRQQPSEW